MSSSPTLVSIPKGIYPYPNYSGFLVPPLNLMSDTDPFCDKCGRDPCVWELDKSTIVDLFNARYKDVKVEGSIAKCKQEEGSRCFYLYQQYTRKLYGVLGRGVRIRHPPCIVEGIHSLAPDPMNEYKGHVDVIEP